MPLDPMHALEALLMDRRHWSERASAAGPGICAYFLIDAEALGPVEVNGKAHVAAVSQDWTVATPARR